MKKTLIALAVLATSTAAFASDGQVNFTGSITDVSCTVDTGSVTQTVDLGKVSKTAFSAAGSTAAAKQFTVKLTDCPATITSAKVRFDGTQVPGDNSVLALTTAADQATNVGIQLSDDKNNVIKLFEDSAAYTLATGNNDLKFTARYYATAAAVTTGSANAVTNFTIIYP